MAGTLTISTLSDGTNSTSATNCIQGSAKAWVCFNINGGSPSTYASYNVSSISYVSTGVFNVNFTNALSDTNYGVIGSSVNGNNADFFTVQGNGLTGNFNLKTTTQVQVRTQNGSGSASNNSNCVSVAIFR